MGENEVEDIMFAEKTTVSVLESAKIWHDKITTLAS